MHLRIYHWKTNLPAKQYYYWICQFELNLCNALDSLLQYINNVVKRQLNINVVVFFHMEANKRFRKIVAELGYNQKEIAERLRITPQSVSLYFQDKRKISSLLALAIAYTDNVNPDWLLEGKGKKFLGKK